MDKNYVQSELAKDLIYTLAYSANEDEFCKNLVHAGMRQHGAIGASLCMLNNDSAIQEVGHYGVVPHDLTREGVTVWGNSVMSQSIRMREHVSLEMPGEAAYADLESNGHWLTAIPLVVNEITIGGLGLTINLQDGLERPEQKELELVGLVTQVFLSNCNGNGNGLGNGSNGARRFTAPIDENLTERQVSIVKLMAEDQTNYQIGRALMLSESSIKQESVKIFKKLRVNNRADAVLAARASELIE